MDAAFVLFQHDATRLVSIIRRAPPRALASRLLPVRSQRTPVASGTRLRRSGPPVYTA
jgi:hypothetical protein